MNGKFRLDSSIQHPISDHVLDGPSAFSCTKLQIDVSNESLALQEYTQDVAKGKYNISWDSLGDMLSWLQKEQESKIIELRLKWRRKNKSLAGNRAWHEKHYYVCAREGTGGEKGYEKKHPEWGRKVPVKRSGCACRLIVKIYPHTPCVLGKYNSEHSHPIGYENARYTQLSKDTRIRIAEMIRMGISHAKIVRDKICRLMN